MEGARVCVPEEVGVCEGARVCEPERVELTVRERVSVTVGLGEAVTDVELEGSCVTLGDGVRVLEKVRLRVAVALTLGDPEGVEETVPLRVAVALTLVAECERVCEEVRVNVGEAVGVGGCVGVGVPVLDAVGVVDIDTEEREIDLDGVIDREGE